MAENQKTFMLWICEHKLQTFSSSAVTFATADNSIAATAIGTSTFTAGEYITVSGAAETNNNTTSLISTVAAGKLVITSPSVTAESASASVVINEEYYGTYQSTRDFKYLTGTIYTSQACTLYIDQSRDGTNIDHTDTIAVGATTYEAWKYLILVSGYARFRILNGGTDQTSVRCIMNGLVN
jgi:hypothetical protein